MRYSEKKLVCRKCGFEKEAGDVRVVIKSEVNREEIPVIEGEKVQALPTTKVICPSCGNTEAFWWMRQLRAADESEVRFFRCTKCGKTWREYN